MAKTIKLTDEELQQHYIELDSDRFDMICMKTEYKLTQIDNKFVKEVLITCRNARRITFKQFKVLWNFIANVVPEYRDFN